MQRSGWPSKKRSKFMGQLDRVAEGDVVMDCEKMKALLEGNRGGQRRNAKRKSKSFASRIHSRIGNIRVP